jgi:hypothetical protein
MMKGPVFIGTIDDGPFGVAKTRRRLNKGIEHRLQVER